MRGNSQSGAVFYYILLAVVLVAALSYAVSNSNRASTGTLSADQAQIATNELLDYYNALSTSIQKLQLRGCDPSEISYEGADTGGFGATDYDNTTAPTDESCHIFSLSGGSLNYQTPSQIMLDQSQSSDPYFGHTYFIENSAINMLNSSGSHTNYAITPFVKEEICLEISKRIINFDGIISDSGTNTINPDLFDGGAIPSGGPPFNCNVNNPFMPIQDCGDYTGCLRLGGFKGNGIEFFIAYHFLTRDPP